MLELLVAITTSQQPSNEAFPAKQRPETIPTSGTLRREPKCFLVLQSGGLGDLLVSG
jgi:hypothetical protein